MAPEEVLLKNKRAPQRYAERDIYNAHESLPNDGRDVLPDSDLLKALHSYTSHFYEVLGWRRGEECFVGTRHIDERSMDETALLAFGILLEEAGREALGARGDLVFTEAQEPRELGQELWKRRYPKRRKLNRDHQVEPHNRG